MNDPELDHLTEAELRDRLMSIATDAHDQLLRLTASLANVADALDDLASATNPDPVARRRAAFRREECPGRF